MKQLAFILAAILEIGRCYLIWLGQGRPSAALQIAGVVSLAAFGYVIAAIDTGLPTRTYAVYSR